MSKIAYIGIFILFTFLEGHAQTLYYQLTNIKNGREDNKNVTGGQFVTFTPKYCYESDKEGFVVNDSKLTFLDTENGISYYSGIAYWGNCTFAFNSSKSVLNVITKDGDVYVYHQRIPPANVKTSSLIKKQTSERKLTATGVIPLIYDGYGGTVNTQDLGNQSSESNNTVKKSCHLCYGTGICQTCNGKGWYYNPFGTGTVSCPNCDRAHNGICSSCHGIK